MVVIESKRIFVKYNNIITTLGLQNSKTTSTLFYFIIEIQKKRE